jgi:hypothetical protein
MRRLLWLLSMLAGCGGGGNQPKADAPTTDSTDAPASACQPTGVTGSFYRRAPEPRLVAGRSFLDGRLEVAITDPDLHWDDAAQLWHLYYHGPRATSYTAPSTPTIAHATSPDLATWTVQDSPALTAAPATNAWDHASTEMPAVVENPDAPADRRYLLVYGGANGQLANGRTAYAIGAAFSADGATFTRVAAAESPHGQDGLVLTGADVYPSAGGALVADPEVVYVAGTYHLWFSSYGCTGGSCATTLEYGIAHATSSDGVHWSVAEAPVRSLLGAMIDPTSGAGQPSVIYDPVHCRWEMWSRRDGSGEVQTQPAMFDNMAGVWRATSMDGVTWNASYTGPRDLDWMQSASGEHLGLRAGTDVAAKGNGRYLVYVGLDDQSVPAGFVLPTWSSTTVPGVTTLELATRDVP